MDRIDRQIVHCLRLDGRASFHRIGQVIGSSEQTVARRYRALVEAGALRVTAVAEPVTARTWFARIICRPGAAASLAEAVAARDDVSWVSLTAGGSEVFCATHGPTETETGPVLLERLPRSAQALRFTAFSALHVHDGPAAAWRGLDDPLTPAQAAQLTRTDRTGGSATPGDEHPDDDALIDLLQPDGRATIAALAAALGRPAPSVSARLGRLRRSGRLTIETDVVPRAFGFTAAAFLLIKVAPNRLHRTGQDVSALPATGFTAAVTGSANLLTAVTGRDDEDLYRLVTSVIGLRPGVRDIEVIPILRRVKQARSRLRHGRLDPVR